MGFKNSNKYLFILHSAYFYSSALLKIKSLRQNAWTLKNNDVFKKKTLRVFFYLGPPFFCRIRLVRWGRNCGFFNGCWYFYKYILMVFYFFFIYLHLIIVNNLKNDNIFKIVSVSLFYLPAVTSRAELYL